MARSLRHRARLEGHHLPPPSRHGASEIGAVGL